jgi:N,N'-diacetyllegionaminate synthase
MTRKIKIGDKWVGEGEPTSIIAEVGSNHNGKLNQARQLIDIAADSGADAVKFQLFKAENLYSKNDSMFAVMKANELPQEWVGELAGYARNHNLMFLASPFDEVSVDCLYEVDVPAYKWASSETVNSPLLRYAASKKKPMLISTGMCDLADVSTAVEVVHATGNQDIILLHCVSLYPAKPHQVNLRMMDTMRDAFHLPVGLSDHTLGFVIAAAAVARGACIIEKHFTLSRKLKGPDHAYALEPDELKQIVKAIREVEASLGSPIKDMLPEEKEVARRESVTAAVNIPKGTRLIKDMLSVKRPAFGIKPRFLDVVIGTKAKTDIEQGKPITWDMISQ